MFSLFSTFCRQRHDYEKTWVRAAVYCLTFGFVILVLIACFHSKYVGVQSHRVKSMRSMRRFGAMSVAKHAHLEEQRVAGIQNIGLSRAMREFADYSGALRRI